MNASALLQSQGWLGAGHSLDTSGRGIKKPLLIAHKQDQLGLGQQKAAHRTDDQWWMRAFDESLATIGTGKESTLNQIRTKGVKRGGLYGFFVRGEGIGGTIGSLGGSGESSATSGASTPVTEVSSESEEVRRARKKDRAAKKELKRKRDASGVDDKKVKKTGRAEREAQNKKAGISAEDELAEAVVAKIAKLKPEEKKEYEKRAAEKNQTLSQYVLRRIQKKAEKQATKGD